LINKSLKIALITIFIFSIVNAQFFDERDFLDSKLTWKDSIPQNMPFIKKPFWSEDGIFRKLDWAPDSRYEELIIRKDMMQWHQKISLLNLGIMTYQYYLGKEIDQNGAYSILGGDKYNDYKSMHKNLGYASYGLYMTSAGLSVFSPPALKYDKKISSMKLHRYLALIHFTGMSMQPWLGYQAATGNNYDKYMDKHRKVGEIVYISYFLSFLLTLMES